MFDRMFLVLRKIIVKIENFTNNYEGSDHEPTLPPSNQTKIKPKNNTSKKEIKNNKIVKKIINKESLAKKIKRNMFFLDELIIKLEDKPSYVLYYEKVIELKTQSEATYKILHRMTSEKPYYQKTLETILKHTNIISELLED